MNIFKQKGISKKLVKQTSILRDEPDWLVKLRLNSLDIYHQLNKNCNKNDFNKYVDDKYFINKNPKFNTSDFSEHVDESCLFGIKHQVDSEIVLQKFFKESKDKGVLFCSLTEACVKYPKLIKKKFGKLIPSGNNLLSAFSAAFWSGGTFIYVPSKVSIDIPFQVSCFINCGDFAQIERSLIILDQDSSVNINEICSTSKIYNNLFHLLVSEIYIGKNAKLRINTSKKWSKKTVSLSNIKADLSGGASFIWNKKIVGGSILDDTTEISLTGNSSKYDQKIISLANTGQNHTFNNLVEHKAPKCSSSIITKTILKNRAVTVNNNSVVVAKGAKMTKSFVKCDGIIDGENSVYKSYPNLSSYEKQAEINHESTLGKIDDEQIFYLQTKGFTKVEARKIITLGFVNNAEFI
jgi:Fe-S cluster assembly protein SufB